MARVSKKITQSSEEDQTIVYQGESELPIYEIESPVAPKRRVPWKLLIGFVVLFTIVAGGYALFARKEDPSVVAAEELTRTIEDVSRLIVLPADEEPTLATVSDPERLKDNEFFKNAKIGDKVLIYAKARKAILYSPELKKIIEVAPLNYTNAPSDSENR